MKKELKKEIKEILNKLKQGEFCQPNCFGCCGDNCIDINCDVVVDNFIKELYNAGYHKADETQKETAKKIYEKAKFIVLTTNDFGKKFLHLDVLKEIINNIEYYVKIEELIAKNRKNIKRGNI